MEQNLKTFALLAVLSTVCIGAQAEGNIFGVAVGFGLGTAAFDLFLSQLLGISNGALIGLLFQSLRNCEACGTAFLFAFARSKR